MKYPFLENNELILIDYMPGSSGQLLLRLWSELDSKLNYNNDKILSDTTITAHPSSREVDYDIKVPKRMVNWFLDKSEPDTVYDYVQFFEFLAVELVAQSQRWIKGSDSTKFYEDNNYTINGTRMLYGMHTWGTSIPYAEMQSLGYNIKCISIVPRTKEGLYYQYDRFQACYPFPYDHIIKYCSKFNETQSDEFDFCTLLVTKNTGAILNWLKNRIGDDFRNEKVPYVVTILNQYYSEIVNKL